MTKDQLLQQVDDFYSSSRGRNARDVLEELEEVQEHIEVLGDALGAAIDALPDEEQ